jgi:hypothetical protein
MMMATCWGGVALSAVMGAVVKAKVRKEKLGAQVTLVRINK